MYIKQDQQTIAMRLNDEKSEKKSERTQKQYNTVNRPIEKEPFFFLPQSAQTRSPGHLNRSTISGIRRDRRAGAAHGAIQTVEDADRTDADGANPDAEILRPQR
jgi:hypothetical protein